MIKLSNPITHDQLLNVLDYDSNIGVFTWKENRKRLAIKGSVAGSKNGSGYIHISLGGRLYLAHRLAWFYAFEEWPEKNIDHIDKNRTNNRLDNLRDVSQSINIHNADTSSRLSKSGFKNARKVGNRWQSEIKINGKSIHLGMFSSGEEASMAAETYRKAL